MSAKKLRRAVVLGMLAATVGGTALSVAQAGVAQAAPTVGTVRADVTPAASSGREEMFSLQETIWD